MSGSYRDRRRHRRKVAGTAKGKAEHQKRNHRRKRPEDSGKPEKEEK